MRLALSFFGSVTLHALALASPISFSQPKPHDLIQVTILAVQDESSGGSPRERSTETAHSRTVKSTTHSFSANRDSAAPPGRPNTDLTAQSSTVTSPPDRSQSTIEAATLLSSMAAETQIVASVDESSARDGIGVNDGSGRGDGNGSAEVGSGLGQGSDGSGRGGNFTQARYRETPKPAYPESARRRGREGTVLLRVLVDDEGRAKSVEINKSSGDDSLDRAARDAVQRWRFVPARHGEKAVEGWIRIPVDFRIADTNSR